MKKIKEYGNTNNKNAFTVCLLQFIFNDEHSLRMSFQKYGKFLF
jgi:hypothetical protein